VTRNLVVGLIVLTALVGAAGCGGGGGSSDTLTIDKTRPCFEKAGLKATLTHNRYLPGAVGYLQVEFESAKNALLDPAANLQGRGPQNQDVFLVFEQDPAGALADENKAVRLAIRSLRSQGSLITRAAVVAGVGLTKNVFYYSSTGALTKSERTKVESCLA
jgi:hypothetical protein